MKYIFLIVLSLIISCKSNYNQQIPFGESCYKNEFLTMKGIVVDTIKTFNKIDVMEILLSKKNNNSIKFIDSLDLKNNKNYVLSKSYIVKTSNKEYLFSFFQNTEYSIRDIYLLTIKCETDKYLYFIDECFSYDLFRFGDYNNDGNIEYVEIDTQNDFLLFISLENGSKIELKNLKLKLKEVPINSNDTFYVIKRNNLK